MRPSKKYVELLEKIFPYRFTLAKLTHIPLVRSLIKKMIFEHNNLTYLPKDQVITINKTIEQQENMIIPSAIVEHFIHQSTYHVIMKSCICREANQCKNYPIDLGCLFMGEAAKEIPRELGRHVTKQDALDHVQRCRELGLVHLIGRDKLDETWLGVGSKIPLITVCNCCDCCCLWRMIPNLDETLSSTVKKMPGISIQITDKCVGCGACTDHCFVNAINLKGGKAVIGEECRICGRCAEICPNHAIKITIENEDFIQQTIDRVQQATK